MSGQKAWLVTGGSGFLGRHLLKTLTHAAPVGVRVVAMGRRRPEACPVELFVPADLDEPVELARALRTAGPEVVFHLAGQLPTADPARLYQGNTRATVHLLDALRGLDRPVRVVMAGSAAELGPLAAGALPVGEESPCNPVSPYGLSKWFATRYGLNQSLPLEVLSARIFNPIGPGMPVSQAFGRFAAVLAAPGIDPVRLKVSGLDARRDFIDVGDVADALLALALRGQGGLVYHVGTGCSHRVGDGLDILVGLSGRQVCIDVDPTIQRPGTADSRARIDRIRDHTGWGPRIAWELSLANLWREALEKPKQARRVA
ncbi:MAG: NAD-dependent epimerase/dehydratase family protein [Isosphaeraceae bacterium]